MLSHLLNKLVSEVAIGDGLYKLVTVEPLTSKTLEPVAEALEKLYASEDANRKRLATLLNAVYSARKPSFLLSSRCFEALLRADDMATAKTISGDVWASFTGYLCRHGFLIRDRPSVKKNAAVFSLAETTLLIFKDLNPTFDVERYKSGILDFYDSRLPARECAPVKETAQAPAEEVRPEVSKPEAVTVPPAEPEEAYVPVAILVPSTGLGNLKEKLGITSDDLKKWNPELVGQDVKGQMLTVGFAKASGVDALRRRALAAVQPVLQSQEPSVGDSKFKALGITDEGLRRVRANSPC